MYGGDQIYTSTDSGVTWTPRDSARNWQAVASSADGSKLVAVVQFGYFYTSTDSGVTWTQRASNRGWSAVPSSADGSKFFAAAYGAQIYTSGNDRSTPGTGGSVSGAQYDALELQYLGSGLFMPLSYTNNSGSFVVQ